MLVLRFASPGSRWIEPRRRPRAPGDKRDMSRTVHFVALQRRERWEVELPNWAVVAPVARFHLKKNKTKKLSHGSRRTIRNSETLCAFS